MKRPLRLGTAYYHVKVLGRGQRSPGFNEQRTLGYTMVHSETLGYSV